MSSGGLCGMASVVSLESVASLESVVSLESGLSTWIVYLHDTIRTDVASA